MSERNDAVLLGDIREYGQRAQRFAAGRAREDLENDELLREALIRELEVVGEAIGRLSDGWRAARPEIPWRAWTGMRNRLIHGYFAIDLDIVWTAVVVDLPAVLATVAAALEEEESGGHHPPGE